MPKISATVPVSDRADAHEHALRAAGSKNVSNIRNINASIGFRVYCSSSTGVSSPHEPGQESDGEHDEDGDGDSNEVDVAADGVCNGLVHLHFQISQNLR